MFSQYVILKNQVGAVNLAMGAGVSMGFQGIIRLPAVTSSCQPNPTLAGFALWLSLQDPVGIKTKSIRMMQIYPPLHRLEELSNGYCRTKEKPLE